MSINPLKRILFLLFIVFSNGIIFSQSIVENVPDSLKDESHFILLNEDYTFTIKSTRKTYTEVTKNFVVLKKSKYIPELLNVSYDKFNKISKLKVRIYDKNNKKIKKYTGKDFSKFSMAYYGVTADQGIKYFIIPDITPPFRVEFSYKVKSENSLFYPMWSPLSNQFQSILNAKLTVIDETGDNLRYKLYNIGKPIVTKEENKTVYKWSIKNRKYVKFEPFNNILTEYLPGVQLAPKNFELENYSGNMNSWASFSDWIYLLNKKQNDFTPQQKQKIKSIVKNTDSKQEKIKKIYKFMQDNMHYASIQLGIGGWKPMTTSFVHEKKYGDCKALTYYTKSMLDLVGVKSFYTLVNAGKNAYPVPSDFPNAHFNHAFLTIPLENDTMWLECTSQIHPTGYIGSFTDDRNVLMIKKAGGQLIKSKTYTASENKNTVYALINLDTNGNAKLSITNKMTGLAIEKNGYIQIIHKGNDKQKKWLYDNLQLNNFKIIDFEITPYTDELIPKGGYTVKIDIEQFAKTTGNKLLLKPFEFHKPDLVKLPKKKRKHNIQIPRAFEIEDSVKIIFPTDYRIASPIKNIAKEAKYGKYSFDYELSDDFIILKRKIVVNKGNYKPEEYADFRSFINKLLKISNRFLVLTKE